MKKIIPIITLFFLSLLNCKSQDKDRFFEKLLTYEVRGRIKNVQVIETKDKEELTLYEMISRGNLWYWAIPGKEDIIKGDSVSVWFNIKPEIMYERGIINDPHLDWKTRTYFEAEGYYKFFDARQIMA
jgi:hypothetical protein